jgi:Sulfotransferase family
MMTDNHDIPFDFQPIVIIGAARSGTNVLRNSLTAFDGFATWPCDEINSIWRRGSTTLRTDELTARQATPQVRRYIRQAFVKLARKTNAQFVVEKTCANSLRIEFVRAVLPEAKFVFLVRDGRDVVASALHRWKANLDLAYTLKKLRYVPPSDLPRLAIRFASHRVRQFAHRERRLPTWGPRFVGMDRLLRTCTLAEVCAEQWRRCVARAAAGLADLPEGRAIGLRYEAFVVNPAFELQRVFDWLGCPVDPARLQDVCRPVSASSVGKWQFTLDPETVAAISPIVGPPLSSLDRDGLAAFKHEFTPSAARHALT